MAGYAGLQCLTETKDVLNRAKGGRCLLMVNAFFHSGENGKGLHGNHMKSYEIMLDQNACRGLRYILHGSTIHRYSFLVFPQSVLKI